MICTYERQLLFDDARLYGMAEFNWAASFAIRHEIDPDVFAVMPNHIHAILWINDANVGAQGLAPVPGRAQGLAPLRGGPGRPHVAPRSLGSLVRAYKSSVTRDVNALLGTPGLPVWQRNYYEHVIRSERALERIRRYVLENPERWEYDRENPHGRPDDSERAFWAAVERMGATPPNRGVSVAANPGAQSLAPLPD